MVFQDSKDKTGLQIYDTSYLFVFGDLNYRISINSPQKLSLDQLSRKTKDHDVGSLLLQDQLLQEKASNRALQGLSEDPITFLPSYKYLVHTSKFKVRYGNSSLSQDLQSKSFVLNIVPCLTGFHKTDPWVVRPNIICIT